MLSKNMFRLSSFSVGVLFLSLIAAEDLPSWITPCSTTGPETNDCIKENILTIFRRGANGYPDRKISAMDPLFIERATSPAAIGSISLKQDFINFTFTGLSNLAISQLKATFDTKCQIKFKYSVPASDITGTYAADGRLLLFQVKGSDKFEIHLKNITGVGTIDCEFYEKGERYFSIKNINFSIRPESGKMNFANIIRSNAQLSQSVNDLLNDSFEEVLNEYSPTLVHGVEVALKNLSNDIVKDIPIRFLFKQ